MRNPTILRAAILLGAIAGSLVAQTTPPNNFLVHNLVSDLPGVADKTDKNLVNPWGNGFGQSPFWVGNNGSGTSTLYNGIGTPSALIVIIPKAGGADGGPVTGVIQNTFAATNTGAFRLAPSRTANFLFCSEDGVISGWNPNVDGTHAKILVDQSKSGAVYKGCAIGGTTTAPLLFAANFNSGAIDVVDGGSLNLRVDSTAFVNPVVPAGFAPFNIQNIGGTLYVAYAKQDGMKKDDVAGPGNGYVATFDFSGKLIANLVVQAPLNSPWGMAIAPASFGPFGGNLLVANFGDGKINAFSLTTGKLAGTLNDVTGNPIVLQGLWSINFGSGAQSEDPGTLYFTAGIGGGPNSDPPESHGLLGSIQGVPSFVSAGVINAGSLVTGPIAPNTWVAIKGNELAPTTANWVVTGTTLPTTTGGVGVKVGGEAAPVSFVSSTQINFLVPADILPGPTQIQVTNNGLTSATAAATVTATSLAFFPLGTAANGNIYIAATHADGSLVGPTTLIAGKTTPAKPGETIVLYGTGFGAPLSGATGPLPVNPTIVIDAIPANVVFAGLIGPGLYQFNVVVPAGVRPGDSLTIALLGNAESQANAYVTIAAQ